MYKTKQQIGKEAVQIVLPMIQENLGECFTATKERFNTLDLESESYWVEVKSRCPPYHPAHPKLADGWLIPTCKIERAKKESKQTFFFYFFWEDGSLWKYRFKPEDFQGLIPKKPWPSNQDHYVLPQAYWERVNATPALLQKLAETKDCIQ
jgi:hypothetical protein